MSKPGIFVISLDFELFWGMFDKVTLRQYGDNIAGVHSALPRLLRLFQERGIHATWATVGMLMHENKEEMYKHFPVPSLQPQYDDMQLSAYEHVRHADLTGTNQQYYFGKHLVELILATPNQELASHTFSHYYVVDGAENCTSIFGADCDAFTKGSAWTNRKVTSVVFPRNQITTEALHVCAQKGFTCYRGTPEHFLYTGKAETKQTNLFLRALRLIDTYVNITGHHTHARKKPGMEHTLTNIPGSWFLRPYNQRLRFLEWLKIRRIKNAMTHAAKRGEIYHLWWHPHNVGINQAQNFKNLETILDHFLLLQNTYAMESLNMQEMAHPA